MTIPTLYSFRRCPYAMRARLGLVLAKSPVSLREIVLKHKPEAMLLASPKGTVPVLILQNGEVIEESFEIMCWALAQNDPHDLLLTATSDKQEAAKALIDYNDQVFKSWLDKYKYADRHPEYNEQYYREQGEVFIAQLENLLSKHPQLLRATPCIADYAIYPFIRQFAHVDKAWFEQSAYKNVQLWLANHLQSDEFITVMQKFPTWLENEQSFVFGQ
ncbi:glutathione S-transferase [Shewanella sp. Bg11-22]|uniref:glutathione S-transferase n=1 Tax=Shewanella sp. Bg11-22 TaxID=2058304 RepID=UPI000C32BEF8|nr:glutathione S-transferase [Shewanella sp. Bg11-22]PKH59275.1 glutathione S-transferase [Shewanella sp. Bg11-22]